MNVYSLISDGPVVNPRIAQHEFDCRRSFYYHDIWELDSMLKATDKTYAETGIGAFLADHNFDDNLRFLYSPSSARLMAFDIENIYNGHLFGDFSNPYNLFRILRDNTEKDSLSRLLYDILGTSRLKYTRGSSDISKFKGTQFYNDEVVAEELKCCAIKVDDCMFRNAGIFENEWFFFPSKCDPELFAFDFVDMINKVYHTDGHYKKLFVLYPEDKRCMWIFNPYDIYTVLYTVVGNKIDYVIRDGDRSICLAYEETTLEERQSAIEIHDYTVRRFIDGPLKNFMVPADLADFWGVVLECIGI